MIFKSWPILAGGLLIAAAVFTGFMPASVSAQSHLGPREERPQTRAAQRSCSETSDFVAQSGNQPNWAEADWTTNSCGWYIRGFAHCESGRNFILYTGGWITSVNKESRAPCTTGYPVLAGGGYDFKQCSSCAYTRVWKFGHIKESAAQCSRSITVTHSSNLVQAQMNQTCGHLYRAYGDWSGDFDYGPWRARNGLYSVACDVSSCTSHPDGSLSSGGYQSHDGTLHPTFGTEIGNRKEA